jgi:hypothetical protein
MVGKQDSNSLPFSPHGKGESVCPSGPSEGTALFVEAKERSGDDRTRQSCASSAETARIHMCQG